jgi:hypothetical protein
MTCVLLVWAFVLACAPEASAVTLNGMYQGVSKVTSFSFPSSSVSAANLKGVSSPDFTAQIASGSVPITNTWRTQISITTNFTRSGVTVPASSFAVQGPVQGATWDTLTTERTVATNLAPETLDSGAFRFRFIPSTGLAAGDYTGTLRIRAQQYNEVGVAAGASDQFVNATVHVLGYIAVIDVTNVTADVTEGQTSGPVSAISFPSQTTGTGLKVRSDSLRVRTNANTKWDLYASVDTPFQKIGSPTVFKPASSFGFCLGTCMSITNFTGVGVLAPVAQGNATGSLALSPLFQFVSRSVNVEAGDYTGSFTLTILVS